MFQLIASGSTEAAIAEQFSEAVRLSGLALGATTATALFGGAAPYVVHTLQKLTGIAEIPGIVIAAVAACIGLTLAIFLPHRGSAAPDHQYPA
jgi:MHS family proline/betaine transporter-like MFS transporter